MFRIVVIGGVNKSLWSASPAESTDSPKEFELNSEGIGLKHP